MKVTAPPSPRGTNNERLFLFHCPRGIDPRGALDSVMLSMKGSGRDSEEQNLAELRRKLEDFTLK
jgi:hypothetical protein